MVKVHLSKLLGIKRINQASLARSTGIRPATINDLYHEFATQISFEQLNQICESLDCSISDLLEYIPDEIKSTGKNLILEAHGNRRTKRK